jgi:hypothetical protein
MSLHQFANQFFFRVLADFRTKRPVQTLSPQESLPASTRNMKISSPRFSQSIDFELSLLYYNQANQFCLFPSGAAAQARSLGAIASFGHDH